MSDKNNEIFESIDEIRAAIGSELEITEEFADFRVLNRRKEGSLWILEIEPVKALSGLDESYEGSPVWWGSPSAGSADLLTIIPEINQIVLRYATGPPPDEGYLVRIYPPRYLESLKKVWGDDTWACSCIETLNGLLENQSDANGFLNFKAPVRGLFAGDETVTPNGASDIMPYVGRKRALGCALFPMYLMIPPTKFALV